MALCGTIPELVMKVNHTVCLPGGTFGTLVQVFFNSLISPWKRPIINKAEHSLLLSGVQQQKFKHCLLPNLRTYLHYWYTNLWSKERGGMNSSITGSSASCHREPLVPWGRWLLCILPRWTPRAVEKNWDACQQNAKLAFIKTILVCETNDLSLLFVLVWS